MIKYKLIIFLMVLGIRMIYGAEKVPVELKDIGIEEHLGDVVSQDIHFSDELGKEVLLGDYFDGIHPVILALVYYNCPNLCHYLLNGFSDSLQKLSWTAGKEFRIITVSIDPTETFQLSQKKKEYYLKKYGKEEQAADISRGWHFLTGTQKNIQQLSDQVGFHFRYDEDRKEYAHSAAIFILTPTGKISRYLYGIQFKPLDLKLSLLEASQGKVGNVVDRFLLFCYHYDPKGRRYAIFAVNLMKLGGLSILCGVIFLVIGLGLSKSRRRA